MSAKPPPPPKFEKVPENWWEHLTDEDQAFLEQLEKEGRLSFQSDAEIHAEIEAERRKWAERLRRAEERLRRAEERLRRAGDNPDASASEADS